MTGTRKPVLLAVTATDSIATGMVLPILPFIAAGMHISSASIGVLVAAYALAQMLASMVWGVLADRFGVRPLLIAAPLISACGALVFAFATGFGMLLAGRIIAGFGAAVVLLVQVHITATTSQTDRTGLLGQVTAMQGFGNIFGPTIGGLLARHGVIPVGLAAAATTLAAAGVTAVGLPSAPRQPRAGGSRLPLREVATIVRMPALRGLGLTMFVTWFCFAGFATIAPLRLEDHLHMTVVQYGLLGMISGSTAIVIRGLLLKRLVRRFGETRLMMTGAAVLCGALTFTPLLPSLWLAPVLPLMWACGASMLFPSMVGKLSKAAAHDAAGRVMSGGSVLVSMGLIFGPAAAGASLQSVGGVVPFLVGASVFAAVAAVSTSSAIAEHRASVADPPEPTVAVSE